MVVINLKKEWDFVIFETHKEKPNTSNLIKRELLFVIQNLLNMISEPRKDTELVFLKKIYLKSKRKYLELNI